MYKALLLFSVLSLSSYGSSLNSTVRRNVIEHTSDLDLARLSNSGNALRLALNPTFGQPHQATFANFYAVNGQPSPNYLRPFNGQLLSQDPRQFFASQSSPDRSICGLSNSNIDPYFLLLLSHYAKYLPLGLGSQGFYGSTGLPKARPIDSFKYNDKA